MSKSLFKVFSVITILALALAAVPLQSAKAATPAELFFSEYIEGSSNNKALEIYNGTGAAINLATSGYSILMSFNGGTSTFTINLSGTVANGDVYVVAPTNANTTILAQADQTAGTSWFNGDDAVVLRKGTTNTIIDAIGQIGVDPGTEWGIGLVSTQDNTLRRADTICAGDPNASDVFDPSLEWEGFAQDTFGGLGAHTANCSIVVTDTAPTVTASYPTNGQTGVPLNADMSVTFNEPVNVIDPWFTISCSVSGVHGGTASGGPTTFTINPTSDFVGGETCTFTVIANSVTDQDANDPPDEMSVNFVVGFSTTDVCAQPYTTIPAIQGSGATVALPGSRTTQGVVVGDYEGPSPALRGFFIQDPVGDSDPATSDGIFVFEGSNANTVSVGDLVRVTGTAGENQGQSQISVGSIVKCGTGTITPTDVTFPLASADFLERYEGMLVRLPQTMYVTEHFQLGRFGQVVLSSGGRLQQPTNMVNPGPLSIAMQIANNLNRIIIDDGLNNQNPDPILFGRGGLPLSASNTLRGGDTATNIVGVMTYTWAGNSASGNAYRVRPINALNGYVNFDAVNLQPSSAPNVGGTLKVTGMNLLNFFNTFDGIPDNVDNCTFGVGGLPADCRGADTQSEFDRQVPKTVAAILAMNPDVIGINEIENDGYGLDSSIQYLVDQLNAYAGAGTYAFIDVDAATGQVNALGTDAIKVGMLYKPASVTPVGQTAALNSIAFVNGGDSDPRSRPSLAQAFEQNSNGQRFIVNVNHLKSKGDSGLLAICTDSNPGNDTPNCDQGDGQGYWNHARSNSATELMNWLATDPTGTGDPDILLIGDYNSYAMEDPITVIKNAGFTNLIESFLGPDAYSYVFDGQWGYLDHALGSASIVPQITGVGDYHINSDEPSVLDYNMDFKSAGQILSLYAPNQFRVSDHDPVLVGLCLPPSASAAVTPDVLWPPNHKYVTVTATVNASSDVSAISLLSVTSNEPDNGLGDGDKANDIVILDDFTFDLRAERSGAGSGRIYTITYQVTNVCGNSTIVTATVTVPHNQ